MKKALALVLALALTASAQTNDNVCPPKEKIDQILKTIVPYQFQTKVESVRTISAGSVKLCEVVFRANEMPLIFYTEKEGEVALLGTIFSVKEKKNLTGERLHEYIKVSQEVLAELEKLVDLRYGKGERYIYYITDPDCPFCKKSEPILKAWADKNKVEVRVILYPLPIHPKAFDKSVDIVCSKKTFEDLMKQNYGNKVCEAGKQKINKNINYLKDKVGGTPTFIGMNGRFHEGVPQEKDLDKLIK